MLDESPGPTALGQPKSDYRITAHQVSIRSARLAQGR